jgi:hypothetical protein
MPIFSFVCDTCGVRDDDYRTIEERDKPTGCLNNNCDGFRHRDVVGSMRPHTDLGYATPLLSDAMAVDPSQIAEAQRQFPHHRFAPDGRMIFGSHQERSRVLKDLGYHDRDGYN